MALISQVETNCYHAASGDHRGWTHSGKDTHSVPVPMGQPAWQSPPRRRQKWHKVSRGLAVTWPLTHGISGAGCHTKALQVTTVSLGSSLPRRVPQKVTSNHRRIVGNEMQIDSKTIRLSCEPFDRGQCLKVSLIASLAICIALTREIFFLNLNFFFPRGHLKVITALAGSS